MALGHLTLNYEILYETCNRTKDFICTTCDVVKASWTRFVVIGKLGHYVKMFYLSGVIV